MRLAIFDLDNTLLGGDSDHAWGEFLVRSGLADADHHAAQNDEFYRRYEQGRLDIHAYVRFTLGPVLDKSLDELALLHEDFMEQFVRPMMLPKAIDLVQEHRRSGDRCLVMSATNAFITAPIAREFGIDTLLATDLEVADNHYTGAITGIPCFQDGKVRRLEQWLQLQNDKYKIEESVFYSDSFNDLPLLKKAGTPVAVDPDRKLEEHARRQGWKVISLRQ